MTFLKEKGIHNAVLYLKAAVSLNHLSILIGGLAHPPLFGTAYDKEASNLRNSA